MFRQSLRRVCRVILAGIVLSLLGCRAIDRPPSETATPFTEAQWSSVILPPQSRLWYLSSDLRWAIYDLESSSGTGEQWSYWLVKIEKDGRLATPTLIGESTKENIISILGFSPDSSSFLLETLSSKDQFSKANIWLIKVTDIQNRRPVYTGSGPLHGASWASDSRRFAVFTADWGADLVMTDGTTKPSIVPPDTFVKLEVSLSWNDKSDQILYSDMHKTPVSVWVAELKSGQRHLLFTHPWPVRPIWSPSGESIAILEFADPVAKPKTQLVILDTAGNALLAIDLPGWPEHGEGMWSPDGKHFALVLEGEETSQAYAEVVNLPTGKYAQIPIESGEGGRLRGWSPDSRAIIVETIRDETPILVRMPVAP